MNSQTVQTPDGISWHVESIQNAAASSSTDAAKEHVVLIPSGEGDCHCLVAVAKNLISLSQHPVVITTFDTPGFSRTTAPKEAYAVVTPELIAKQIAGLLEKLQIPPATLFGCSSGGGTVLAVAALYPEHVKCGIVHEVPFACPPPFYTMREGTDEEIRQRCRDFFYQWIEDENDGKRKYKALGEDYFRRLDENYPTWMRSVVSKFEEPSRVLATKENLQKRPLFWTVGGLSPPEFWELDFQIAASVGHKVKTDVLMCNHFPAITVPEETANWILRCIETVNSSSKA